MSLLQLLLKPANRNLLEVVSHLPKLGVGSKVTRKSWEPYGNSYWEVVAVKPRTEDGSAGKVSLCCCCCCMLCSVASDADLR
jgi:hypothetical protein